MTRDPNTLAEGTLLAGRYRLGRQLGAGGMGAVYEGWDELLDRPVALKVLLEALRADSEAVARFEREAKAAAAIAHPGIVQVFDRGRDGALAFVVMERLEGEDLSRFVARQAPVAIDETTQIMAELAEAVAAAHRASVVHRDLKPSNVFLARIGARARAVKVLDFGVAKMIAAAGGLTQTNQVFGTLRYMSPEQVMNSKHVGPATDVYALGAILYEMLVGVVPHEGRSKVELTYKIQHEEPRAPRLLRSLVPAWLDALALRCLHKQASARPTAAELAQRLRSTAEGARTTGSVSALPPPIVIRDAPSRPEEPADSTLRASVPDPLEESGS